MVLLKKTV